MIFFFKFLGIRMDFGLVGYKYFYVVILVRYIFYVGYFMNGVWSNVVYMIWLFGVFVIIFFNMFFVFYFCELCWFFFIFWLEKRSCRIVYFFSFCLFICMSGVFIFFRFFINGNFFMDFFLIVLSKIVSFIMFSYIFFLVFLSLLLLFDMV